MRSPKEAREKRMEMLIDSDLHVCRFCMLLPGKEPDRYGEEMAQGIEAGSTAYPRRWV